MNEPSTAVRHARRRTFDHVAALYDRARPGYPPAVFDAIESLADLHPGARVLEIGCGTGQATLPLAERGYQVTAVELGAHMADLARHKLARFPNVRVEHAAFEDWPLPAEPFALVVSAQAFHWLDPRTRWPKIAAALEPHGRVALFGHQHVAGGDRAFFERAQRCYEQYMPGTPPGLRLLEPEARPHEYAELDDGGLFESPILRQYAWEHTYTTREYLDVLSTYSNHQELAPDARAALFDCIARLIDGDLGGRVCKAYVTDLAVAHKRS